MKLQGRKVAVFVEDLYENLELWYPVLRLREEGAEVVIVGPKADETYKSKEGYPAKADKSADEVSADEFDHPLEKSKINPLSFSSTTCLFITCLFSLPE